MESDNALNIAIDENGIEVEQEIIFPDGSQDKLKNYAGKKIPEGSKLLNPNPNIIVVMPDGTKIIYVDLPDGRLPAGIGLRCYPSASGVQPTDTIKKRYLTMTHSNRLAFEASR